MYMQNKSDKITKSKFVIKSSIKKLRDGISIYKYSNSRNYYCKFYVGRVNQKYNLSGSFEKSCKTSNVNDAKQIAYKFHREWFEKYQDTKTPFDVNFENQIISPFIRSRKTKYNLKKDRLKKSDQAERDESKWNSLKKYFLKVDLENTPEMQTIINETIIGDLKDAGYSNSSINKRLCLIRQTLNHAQKQGRLKSVPDIFTLTEISKPRYPYEDVELNLLRDEYKKIYNQTKDDFYRDFYHYISLLRSAGFRPGVEVINVKKKDLEWIKDHKNPNQVDLKITLYNTKTKPLHPLTCSPYYVDKVFKPEFEPLISKLDDNDFILFPKVENRQGVANKTSKIFTRISCDKNLYYYKDGVRPIYVLRHGYASKQYKLGRSIEDIASLMNTSPRMIRETYLKMSDQTLIERQKRLYPNYKYKKLKVVK